METRNSKLETRNSKLETRNYCCSWRCSWCDSKKQIPRFARNDRWFCFAGCRIEEWRGWEKPHPCKTTRVRHPDAVSMLSFARRGRCCVIGIPGGGRFRWLRILRRLSRNASWVRRRWTWLRVWIRGGRGAGERRRHRSSMKNWRQSAKKKWRRSW
jgi:hypothetical protein